MISSIATNFPLLLDAQLAPFLMVGLSVALLILGHILQLPLRSLCSAIGLCLVGAWVIGLRDYLAINEKNFWGLSFDALGHIGIQLLLPGVMGVSLMALQKKSDYHHKVGSLLLILISCIGAMVTLISHNWMVLFVAIQCMSLPIYGLLAFDTENKMAVSASVRYLVLSAVAMAFMLFGIVLLYAATGSMDFFEQGLKIVEFGSIQSGLVLLGFSLVLVGIGFKLSLCPFHMWAPEVYQGAPFFVIGYMVVIVKGVVVLALLRGSMLLFGVEDSLLMDIIALMSILSMWLGNGLMLLEKNFIRLLAFLSIGHLGYLMIPLLAHSPLGVEAICLDLAAFGLSVLLILANLKISSRRFTSHSIDDFRGLVKENPWQAFFLMVGLLSLVGFPLTAGFIGKYAIFIAGVDGNLWNLLPHLILSSILGLLALAKIMLSMFQPSPLASLVPNETKGFLNHNGVFLVGAMALLFFGTFPDPWLSWVKSQTSTLPFIGKVEVELSRASGVGMTSRNYKIP